MLSGGKRRDKLAIEINGGLAQTKFASLAQLVEHSVDNRKVDGSGPSRSTKFAGLAQLVEQLTCNEKVGSSIPPTGTKIEDYQD